METTDTYIMVRLKKQLEGNSFLDYVCWIPTKLATKAKETGGKIRLYFENKDEWVDGWELPSGFDIKDHKVISKEKANGMYTRLQQFKRFKVAGRPSYKD